MSRSIAYRRTQRRALIADPHRTRGVVLTIGGQGVNQQSFLITSGDTLTVTLNGYIEDGTGRRLTTVPVTITAQTT